MRALIEESEWGLSLRGLPMGCKGYKYFTVNETE